MTARGKSAPPSDSRREGGKSPFGAAAGRSFHGAGGAKRSAIPPAIYRG